MKKNHIVTSKLWIGSEAVMHMYRALYMGFLRMTLTARKHWSMEMQQEP